MREDSNDTYCHSIPAERLGKSLGLVNRYDSMLCKASIAEPMTSYNEQFFSSSKDTFRINRYLLPHQGQQNQGRHFQAFHLQLRPQSQLHQGYDLSK